ncbi:Release factor glutamine methyltransferase [Corynebacterium glaucum]|uniref:Release factor glutamine methyltransferase n=1 Tax=Corynebacterium glaucum TaxID=187491 RepID=A0A1Q2HVZ3_9CORY|nr:peptide chain release factor N(5)-glutamine methyltransferase [Corynebacterium glaucum]AQQ15027.1 Release factor glutamine methyltransferase [Corynebacterium glaucum]WJZ07526.1 Release factor glutamine methyltransferase [Corynebacterium glaucum]
MRPSSPGSTTHPDLRELVREATWALAHAGIDSAANDARLIAAHLLGIGPLQLTFAEATEGFESEFAAAIARRAAREPLQHITGIAQFGPHELAVGSGVFIPRPETEVLAEWGASLLDDGRVSAPTVIDFGTGSGALAIYIAARHPNARVIAVEASPVARGYAERNAGTNGASISIVPGDMTDRELLCELDGQVDLIVANPPYVPETGELDPEVYRDPHEAVFSGADGMDAIRGLVPVAARLLKPGGQIGIEHDDTTSQAVLDVVGASGQFTDARRLLDLTGRARFVTASKLPLCPPPPTTA